MSDELERNLHYPTPVETLKRVGSTQVATGASVFGNVAIQSTASITDAYKREARYMATMGEQPVDVNGLGYKYNNTAVKQVD